MRLIVFFDLPMITSKDVREYSRFRNFLLKNGFIMMQKSVYSRLLLNNNSTKLLREQIIKNLPNAGLVQLMEVTEKQFADIECLAGKPKTNIINSTDRIVKI